MSTVNLLDEDLFLWNEFLEGNADAFGELMRLHYQDLFNYGTRFTKDEEAVKHCIQDLFLECWTDRQTIGGTSFIKYYLLKSLRQKLIRRTSRQKGARQTGGRQMSSWDEIRFESLFNAGSLPGNKFTGEEQLAGLSRKMRKVLVGLSKLQQEVIYLRFYAEADIADIAEIMSLDGQFVDTLLEEVLKKLKKLSGRPSRFFLFWPAP